MSLPIGYTSTSEYVKDILNFLKSHQWLYNYPNINLLSENIFENFSEEFLECFRQMTDSDLIQIALGEILENVPQNFKNLLLKIKKLRPHFLDKKFDITDFEKNENISDKKKHEILCLSHLIHQLCSEKLIKNCIDIGAGLGYLTSLLAEKYNYNILAVECNNKKINFNLESDKIKYFEHFLSKNSHENLQIEANKHFKDESDLCIFGLHACADLSINILDLFLKMPRAKLLIMMPCCYHRLQIDFQNSECEKFKYFPASTLLKNEFDNFDAFRFIKRPFLRLACQQTASSFIGLSSKERERQAENCLHRAVLQKVALEEGIQVSRKKRKTGKKTHDASNDFETFLKNAKTNYELKTVGSQEAFDSADANFLEKMRKTWKANENNVGPARVLLALQTAMQAACENLLLLDRTEFLRENDVAEVFATKVTDDRISPRCFALVAAK